MTIDIVDDTPLAVDDVTDPAALTEDGATDTVSGSVLTNDESGADTPKSFVGWDATPIEQRVKFISIARHVAGNPDYEAQVVNNHDQQNRRLALEKLISQAVGQERKRELDLYKHYASDPDFKRAFDASIMRILDRGLEGKMQ